MDGVESGAVVGAVECESDSESSMASQEQDRNVKDPNEFVYFLNAYCESPKINKVPYVKSESLRNYLLSTFFIHQNLQLEIARTLH